MVMGTPTNATAMIPPFMPGTFNPVVVIFTATDPNQPADLQVAGGKPFSRRIYSGAVRHTSKNRVEYYSTEKLVLVDKLDKPSQFVTGFRYLQAR